MSDPSPGSIVNPVISPLPDVVLLKSNSISTELVCCSIVSFPLPFVISNVPEFADIIKTISIGPEYTSFSSPPHPLNAEKISSIISIAVTDFCDFTMFFSTLCTLLVQKGTVFMFSKSAVFT